MAKRRTSTQPRSPAKVPQGWESVSDTLGWDDVGGRLLANIARGMYAPQGVLREYVQNAVDAYRDLDSAADVHKITITPGANSLSIQDFGTGMDDRGVRAAKKIAVSSKSPDDDYVGFRGIGIWAGLPACKRLIVDTTRENHPYRYRLTFDFEDIMKHVDDNINIKALIDPRYSIVRNSAPSEEHFTRITLEGITDGFTQLLDPEELMRIASQVLPSAIDPKFQHHETLSKMLAKWPGYTECRIFVVTAGQETEAFRKFPEDDLELPEETVLKSDEGAELGRAWFCRTKKAALRRVPPPTMRGFQLRVKNFAVGGSNIFDDEQGYQFNIHRHQELKTTTRLTWYCGEVHVTNSDIRPDTPRNDLERDKAARLFIEKIRGFYKDRINEAGAYSEFNTIKTSLETAEKTLQQAGAKGARTKLPAAERLREILETLEGASSKADKDSKDETKKILRHLLRQQAFKNRCVKAIAGLRPLVSANDASSDDKKPTSAQTKKEKTQQNGQKQKRGGENDDTTPLGLKTEELISEVFEILERHLGEDLEDLPELQEEIQQAVTSWVATHAAKPVS
jgi:hypothetical protein